MADVPPDTADAPPVESGTVRWFDAKKKMGVITRADGSTIFIPPYGLAEGQGALGFGQPVSFVERSNAKGPYAAEVTATGEAGTPPDNLEQIAAELGESAPQALGQIRRILRHMGAKAAWRYVAEAKRVEAEGGMLIPDGSRRRTLGGVFFALVREGVSEEQRAVIFPPLFVRKEKPAKPKAPAEPPPPPPPPLSWEERLDLLAALRQHSGKAITVKVTIIGRPSKIEEQPQVTLLTLTHAGPLPALPKGIPVPDPVPATTYSVYVGKKQWKAVAEALSNPEDVIIVEGTQLLDPASGTIAVFATKTTTKLLQQASRAPRPPADAAG